MGQSLSSKDWIRMLIAFLLGAAVTLLVMQLTSGGTLFQGALRLSGTSYTTDTSTTDTKTFGVDRLSSGIRIDSAKDDESGLLDGCDGICQRGDVCPSDCG